ncbi:MAG: hypothetical protein WCH46_08005 [bacterium]
MVQQNVRIIRLDADGKLVYTNRDGGGPRYSIEWMRGRDTSATMQSETTSIWTRCANGKKAASGSVA